MQHDWKMSHDDVGGLECFPKVVQMKLHTRLARAAFPKVDIVAEVIQGEPLAVQPLPAFFFLVLIVLFETEGEGELNRGMNIHLRLGEKGAMMQTVRVQVAITEMFIYLCWSPG